VALPQRLLVLEPPLERRPPTRPSRDDREDPPRLGHLGSRAQGGIGARRTRPVLPLSCPRKSEDRFIDRRDAKKRWRAHEGRLHTRSGLFPFQSRFYESSVGRIHYIDEGSGIPILLLHGNPTWSFLYRKIVPRLQDAFRCIAVDYPGFGLSDRPDGYGYTPGEHARVIGELVDHLDLDGFLIMIQDWGGPIGFDIADQASRSRPRDRARQHLVLAGGHP
jgi:hypothetical protein